MNGIHDMGGMQDMGPVHPEKNEPVFHARWESRMFGMNLLMGGWGKWNLDASRHSRELIPPADYLRMSYYEKWLTGMTNLIIKAGIATAAEIDTGKSAAGAVKVPPRVTAANAEAFVTAPVSARRDDGLPATFKVGDRVRARNINPLGPTRLPRYARGKTGTIERDHGVFVFPDTNGRFIGEKPQHVYSVRFSARELWGDKASSQDAVYIDLFDDYLEPA